MLALLMVLAASPGGAVKPEQLFSAPTMALPCLSRSGASLAYVAAGAQGGYELKVRALSSGEEHVVADLARRPEALTFSEDDARLLYVAAERADEATQLFAVELASRAVRALTPWAAATVQLLATSATAPRVVLVTANRRTLSLHDVWRIDLVSGAVSLEAKNPGDVISWVADASLAVRAAVATLSNGGTQLRVREGSSWKPLVTAGPEESLVPYGFSRDGRSLVLGTSIASEQERLVEKSVSTGAERLIAQGAGSDVQQLLLHPVRGAVQAAAFDEAGKSVWSFAEPSVKAELEAINEKSPGAEVRVLSRDRADSTWLVELERDVEPVQFALYSRASKELRSVGAALPSLGGVSLAPMSPVRFVARDGVPLSGYLTRPLGPPGPRPMVVLVHGGPWGRDRWGFHPQAQWLAAQGYAVLQVNFRGSAGLGKRLLVAGFKQWGRAMQNDLVDAARWAIERGEALEGHVGVMGHSYGGYATLMALATSPELFRCGVAISAPVNVANLLETIPPQWKALRAKVRARVGDVAKADERRLLLDVSPMTVAEGIRAPVFLAHGLKDARVKAEEAHAFANMLRGLGRDVEWVGLEDEGHELEGWSGLAAQVKAFFARCL